VKIFTTSLDLLVILENDDPFWKFNYKKAWIIIIIIFIQQRLFFIAVKAVKNKQEKIGEDTG
jgi:hypothetical protein